MPSTDPNPALPNGSILANKKEYAPSTFSESTVYSYDKMSTQPPLKPKRSLGQRIKKALKDVGTSPFQYDSDEENPTSGGPVSKPPMRI